MIKIRSSYNADRVATCCINKPHRSAARRLRGGCKTFNTRELYIKLYGLAAYQAWMRRETEITAMAAQGGYRADYITNLREENFRKMKECRPVVGTLTREAAEVAVAA